MSEAFTPQYVRKSAGRMSRASSDCNMRLTAAVSRAWAIPMTQFCGLTTSCSSTPKSGCWALNASNSLLAAAFLSASFLKASRLGSALVLAVSAAAFTVSVAATAVAVVSLAALSVCARRLSRVANAALISPALYVSQNSRFALPCRSLRTRSGSLIPGISTMIWPSWPLPSRVWMLGWATPKRSIRVRSTS